MSSRFMSSRFMSSRFMSSTLMNNHVWKVYSPINLIYHFHFTNWKGFDNLTYSDDTADI